MKTEEFKLRYNSKCLFIDIDSPISTVSIWINKGSRNDPAGKNGLAHFFEHIFMTQTKEYPTREKRLGELESQGVYFNASTFKEKTVFFHIQPVEKTEESLRLLIDGFINTKISEKIFSKEKKIILEEELRNRENTADYIWRLRDRALWPDSSLGADLYGNSKTIKSITSKDIIKFQNNFYFGDNVTFVILGKVNREKILEIINTYFKVPLKTTDELKISNDKKAPILLFEARDVLSTNVGIYYKSTSSTKIREVIALELLKEIMGGTWISLLNQSLRINNNITYWVSGVSSNFSDERCVGVEFSCSKKDVKKAITLSLNEINSIISGLISSQITISKYINSLSSSILRNNITPEQLLWWYDQMKVGDKMNLSPLDYVNELKTITVEEVISEAEKFLKKENRAIVIIGPKIIKKEVVDTVDTVDNKISNYSNVINL